MGGVRLEPLANLAHELRTPLQVMLGYVDILRDEWGKEFSSEPREILERIHLNAQELTHTLGNLLDLAMAQAGGEAMIEEDIAVNDLVDDLTYILETANRNKGLTLDFKLEKAPAVIHCDRRLLRSILVNLALNAVKFTASGSVSIAVRRSQRNGNDFIEFEVRDTGPGIAADQMASAFKPFSQLSNSSTRKYRGLGLGLALVRHHVESLGASLEVNSDPGGSSFIVRISAKKSAGTAAA
jgi:signal transduction histidine kinase